MKVKVSRFKVQKPGFLPFLAESHAGSSSDEEKPHGAVPGSANVPVFSPTVEVRENKFLTTARVSYARGIRRITLQRFLVSLIVFKVKEVTFQDVLVLYDNLIWCQEKSEKDPGFQRKFGKELLVLTNLLKSTRFYPSTFQRTLLSLSVKFRGELESFYYPERNLQGVSKHVKGHYLVLPHRESGVNKKQLPEPRRIGVGYRDKGHRRDPAWDASPSWQEVATYGKQP